MIDQFSASYPIAEAAEATGVSRAHAYAYVWANRRWLSAPSKDTMGDLSWAYLDLIMSYPEPTGTAFIERIEAAIMEGRIYWPYPEWFRDRPDPRQIKVERDEDDDARDLPESNMEGVEVP